MLKTTASRHTLLSSFFHFETLRQPGALLWAPTLTGSPSPSRRYGILAFETSRLWIRETADGCLSSSRLAPIVAFRSVSSSQSYSPRYNPRCAPKSPRWSPISPHAVTPTRGHSGSCSNLVPAPAPATPTFPQRSPKTSYSTNPDFLLPLTSTRHIPTRAAVETPKTQGL